MQGNVRTKRRRNLVASSAGKKVTIRPIVQIPQKKAVKENLGVSNAGKKVITRQIVPTLEKVMHTLKKIIRRKFLLVELHL